ncbi:MAG: alpha/beta hydrolase [Desulfobacterales bacterium]|nr:alpha/beta hydrolase [Desulfobacterales bacterium]
MADTEPLQSTVDIGDSNISYLHYKGEGEPLIMLHATGFNPWLWHPIARGLSDTYQIFCPYFCDYREMDPEAGGFHWMLLAEDLVKFCDALNLASPCMVGHSMGGAVITLSAGKFAFSAEKIVLIEPIFLPQDFYNIEMGVQDHPLASKSIKRRNQWQDQNEARTYLRSRPLFKNWDDEMLELYIRYGMVGSDDGGLALACHPYREAALFMGGMGHNPWPTIPAVKCPVLVLEGEHTENKGLIDFRAAADRFPNGAYQQVKDVGHLIPMEAPELTGSIIRSFFAHH